MTPRQRIASLLAGIAALAASFGLVVTYSIDEEQETTITPIFATATAIAEQDPSPTLVTREPSPIEQTATAFFLPTPTQEVITCWIVDVASLWIRQAPSTDAARDGFVRRGDQLETTGNEQRAGRFVWLELESGNWVAQTRTDTWQMYLSEC